MSESASADNYFANLEKYREATMSQMDMYRENAIQQLQARNQKLGKAIQEIQQAGAGITATGMAMKAVSKKLPESMWKGTDRFTDSRGTNYTNINDFLANQHGGLNPQNFNPFEGQRESLGKQISKAIQDNGDRPTGSNDNTAGFTTEPLPPPSAPKELSGAEFNSLSFEDKLRNIGVNPSELQGQIPQSRLEDINDILRGKGSTETLAPREDPQAGGAVGGGAGDPREGVPQGGAVAEPPATDRPEPPEGNPKPAQSMEEDEVEGENIVLQPEDTSYKGATPSITITEPEPELPPLRFFGAEGSGQRIGQVPPPQQESQVIQEASEVSAPKPSVSEELFGTKPPAEQQAEPPQQPKAPDPDIQPAPSVERPTTRPAELDQAQSQIEQGVNQASAKMNEITQSATDTAKGALDKVASSGGEIFENELSSVATFSAESMTKGVMSSLGIDAGMIGAGGELLGAGLLLGGLAEELMSGAKEKAEKASISASSPPTGSAVGGANIQGFGEQGLGTGGIV